MNDEAPTRILVVANETVVGRPLIDAVKAHADKGPIDVHVICPQNMPRAGWVQYSEEARWAAESERYSLCKVWRRNVLRRSA